MRTDLPLPPVIGLRSAFVLLHVDGDASLQKIATMACLSLPDTIEAFLQLLGLGVVGIREDDPLAKSRVVTRSSIRLV